MPEFNTKLALEKISRLERIQAQLELRANQIAESELKLAEKLKPLGLTQEELPKKIKELEASITLKLASIGNLDA